MKLDAYLRLFLAVLGDWRIIAAVLGTLFAWAVLRYVGLIYHQAPMARGQKKGRKPSQKKAKKEPPPAAASNEENEEE